jgi:hypothetical protein
MSTASDTDPDARPLLRRRPVQVVIAVFALAVAIGTPLVLTQSDSTIFSVNAATGVVEMRPLCPDKVVWDLPPGEVQGRSCLPENPADLTEPDAFRRACSHGPEPVTVTLLAGATAKVELDEANHWLVTFGTAALPGCSVQNTEPLLVSVGDGTLPFDAQGYFYRPQVAAPPPKLGSLGDKTLRAVPPTAAATDLVKSRGAPDLALALRGRVIIGQAMQFGAGWTAGPSPILNSAHFVARSRALGTGDPMTVLDEDVEAGTIIDTHATAEYATAVAGPAGAADDVEQSNGFVQIFDDELLVQLYQPESIGLLPYASETRIIRVSRWRPLWASPPVQLFVSLALVTITLLSLVFAYYQAKENMPKLLGAPPPSPTLPPPLPPPAKLPPAKQVPVTQAQDAPP